MTFAVHDVSILSHSPKHTACFDAAEVSFVPHACSASDVCFSQGLRQQDVALRLWVPIQSMVVRLDSVAVALVITWNSASTSCHTRATYTYTASAFMNVAFAVRVGVGVQLSRKRSSVQCFVRSESRFFVVDGATAESSQRLPMFKGLGTSEFCVLEAIWQISAHVVQQSSSLRDPVISAVRDLH